MILIEIHPRQFAQVIGWIHNVFLSYWIMCMDKVIVSFNCSDGSSSLQSIVIISRFEEIRCVDYANYGASR